MPVCYDTQNKLLLYKILLKLLYFKLSILFINIYEY